MISQKAIPIAILLMFVFVFLRIKKENPYQIISSQRETIDYVLYYGDDSSSSRQSLIYIQQNQIISLAHLVLKEIYYNPENLKEFYSLKEFCPNIEIKEKVEEIYLPVLFLSQEKKCLFGNYDINQYFDKMLK